VVNENQFHAKSLSYNDKIKTYFAIVVPRKYEFLLVVLLKAVNNVGVTMESGRWKGTFSGVLAIFPVV
jgi:hypothetical protein